VTRQDLRAYWIEFGDWPPEVSAGRIPPFPRSCGVTATTVEEALDFIHRGFYEDRELPPILRVTAGVDEWQGPWPPIPSAQPDEPGIWYPKPWYPDRTVVARPRFVPPPEAQYEDDYTPDPDAVAFCERLAELAPELGALLTEHREGDGETLPHLFMGDVTREVVNEFLAGREMPLRTVAGWLEEQYPTASEPVEDVIALSFLDNLPWPPDPDAEAIEAMLGPRLRTRLKEMQNWRPSS
jgi:hypothetical protein